MAASSINAIDDQGSVWIVGTDVDGYSCWNVHAPNTIISLQVQAGNKWITKSRAKARKNLSLCTDGAYPYAVIYHWKTDVIGNPGDGTSLARVILAREYIAPTKYYKATVGSIFTKQLYLSESDLTSDYFSSMQKMADQYKGSFNN